MLPQFHARAQFNGVLRWVCIYCGHIQTDSIRPATYVLKCSHCEHCIWHGDAFHVPANSATKLPRDIAIPSWADDEYPFDTIPKSAYDAMPPALLTPNKIKQRGRIHVILLHNGIYSAEHETDEPT